jgi:hypothetical protein
MRTLFVLLALIATPLALAQTHSSKSHDKQASADVPGAQPGDEALTCEQIQAEMTAIMSNAATQGALGTQQTLDAASATANAHPEAVSGSSPEARAALGGGAANASAQPPPAEEAKQADSGDEPTVTRPKRGGLKGLGKALGAGALGQFGGDRALQAEQQRQIQQMGAAGRAAQEARQPALDAQQAQLAAAAPQLMRGMHLQQLAEAKGCASQPPQGAAPH